MWVQRTVNVLKKQRGFHLITDEVLVSVPEINLIKVGLFHLFIQHTSASLAINENADPDVRKDMESYFSRAVPENEPYYQHIIEGEDDMPAHLKAVILGESLTIPVFGGMLKMGVWQGIYLCEHRNNAQGRKIIVTLSGEDNE